MTRRVAAEINLAALQHNVARVRELAGDASLAAVVKADAYGHGIEAVSRALAPLVDTFAVATLEEGERVRQVTREQQIWLMSGWMSPDELTTIHTLNLSPFAHSREHIEWLARAGDKPTRVALKVDTGMGRLGLRLDEAEKAVSSLRQSNGAILQSIVSHLAGADRPGDGATSDQINRFRHFTDAMGEQFGITTSIANSAAICAWPEARFDWVRPGLMLYGASPLAGVPAANLGLRPVMTLRSRLLSIKTIRAGESVGYGGIWVADRHTRIGIVPCGYGDGYPRHTGSGTPVLVNGRRVPMAGRVSMDLLAVDLGMTGASVGDEVILWGRGLPVEEIAAHANTISYELLTRVTNRVPRILMEP